MKVTFVWRGPSPYRVDFFNELGKLCDVTVLFEMKPSDISDKNTKWFNENYTHFNGIYLHGKKIGNNWFCKDIVKYINLFKKSDIVVIGMYSTLTQSLLINLLKFLKIPYIINSDGGFIKQEREIAHLIKKYLIGGASAYLSSGKKTNDYLRHYGAKSDIYVYPFTSAMEKDINIHSSNDIKNRAKSALQMTEDVIVLYTGQFIHRKGIDVLLHAAKNLPQHCGIYIVGGNPTEEYKSIVKNLELTNIHFIDFKTPQELTQFYQAADIYVLPTREDIWGLVINEAMAYGLPVITTDNCIAGIELIESGKNGYIVEVDNVNQLHDALTKLVVDADLRMSMSHNSKEKIASYTIENMARKHFEIFTAIAEQRKNNG